MLNYHLNESVELASRNPDFIDNQGIKTIYNWLQYFSKNSLESELKQSGLSINSFYADVAGTPYSAQTSEFAIVAKKMA